MAFVPVLVLSETQLLASNGESLALMRVGYDDERPFTYYIAAGLSPCPPDGRLEYHFFLNVINDDEETDSQVTDARLVSRIVPAEHKPHVLIALKVCTWELLFSIRPQHVFMTALVDGIPPRAIEKYRKINQFFGEAGYEVTEAPILLGTIRWDMARMPE